MKLKSTNRQYISYGKSKFDPNKINTSEFSSTLLNKPDGWFWASPVDAKYGWAAWLHLIFQNMKMEKTNWT